ncbi:MAG: hypothetical protein Q8M73_05820 [Actinomycetota bacterium]|nr:hypothetical protein [Actinomycetota bacterium]
MARIRRRTRGNGLASIAVQWQDIRGKLQSAMFQKTAEPLSKAELQIFTVRLLEGRVADTKKLAWHLEALRTSGSIPA